MCEKPFAKDLPEARKMLAAAQAAGVVHALGAEFRFDSAQALLTRLVQSGAIGEPIMFHRIYQQPGPDVHEQLSDWWMDEAQGGGFLGAFGTHMIDQARNTVGEFEAVSCLLRKLSPSRPTQTSDDYYTLQFRTADGCTGLLEAALNFPGPFMMGTKVAGSKGAAWIQSGAAFGDPEEVWIKDADVTRQIPMPPELINAAPEAFPIGELIESEMDRWHSQGFDVAPYAKLFAQLKAQILGASPPLPDRAGDFTDAAANQAILDAARQSAKLGQWVNVEKI
jgi:predicted dehydrogenase